MEEEYIKISRQEYRELVGNSANASLLINDLMLKDRELEFYKQEVESLREMVIHLTGKSHD